MRNNRGKFSFKGLVAFAILGIGAYIGISFLSNNMKKNTIETKVKDSIAFIMGEGKFTEDEQKSAIERTVKILNEYEADGDIEVTPKNKGKNDEYKWAIEITPDENTGKVTYYFEYTIKLNYLLGEKVEHMKPKGTISH